jgi:antitoxin CptB
MLNTENIEAQRNIQQRRLTWRCRRGLLELDIVLQRFINEQFDALSLDELHMFDELLELPDNDFWELIGSSKSPHKNDSTYAVITKLKMVRFNPNQGAE